MGFTVCDGKPFDGSLDHDIRLPGVGIQYVEDMQDQVISFPDIQIEVKPAAHKCPYDLFEPFDLHRILPTWYCRPNREKVNETGKR